MCEAGSFLEGITLAWYNSWLNAPNEHTWQEFFDAMYCRFGHSTPPSFAWMWENLQQEDLVKEYIKAHNKIRQLADSQVHANQGFVYCVFLWNLNPNFAIICGKDCENIEDAFCEACNAKQKAKLTTCASNGHNN